MATFTWYPGSSGNTGQLSATINVMTTELNTLVAGSGIISSVNGASGVFTGVNTGQAIWGDIWFTVGGTAISAVTAGSNLSGWFLMPNSGGTYETPSATTPPPRPPDWMIPLVGTPGTTTTWKSIGVHAVKFPATNFKVFVQNNCSVNLASAGQVLQAGFVAEQY